MSSLPKTVTRQRRGCDLNPGPSATESSTLTTRLLRPTERICHRKVVQLHTSSVYCTCLRVAAKTGVHKTCAFLASVVILRVARPVTEPILRVADAYSVIVRFTTLPVSIRRRVAVVPPGSSLWCGCLFVQSEPVIA